MPTDVRPLLLTADYRPAASNGFFIDVFRTGEAFPLAPAQDTLVLEPDSELQIGARMPDGTIYAGLSPDTGKPMFAPPKDALTRTFNAARKFASKLDAHGHQDWRVPTKTELNVLFQNRAAIGGFNTTGSYPAGWYWSSSRKYDVGAWAQRFSDGHQTDLVRCDLLRCVRG